MKFVGAIGFWKEDKESETEPSVYRPKEIVEKPYRGDIVQYTQRLQQADQMTPDVIFSAQISVNADLYLNKHWESVAYVLYKGVKWAPTAINIDFPRVVISVGGKYHES